MYKAVIFDLDGVLVFTDKYHYLAWKVIADEEGIYFDEKINDRLRGVSRMDSLDIILERANRTYSQEEKNALAAKKNDIYREYLLKMTPSDVAPKTLETLKKLKASGVKIALGSSSKNAKTILKQVDITSLFDAISDGNNITKSKPNPEVFVKAAEFLGLPVEDCVVMEDAFAGIEAGKNGGFDTIAIGDATNDERATYRVNSFEEIYDIITK